MADWVVGIVRSFIGDWQDEKTNAEKKVKGNIMKYIKTFEKPSLPCKAHIVQPYGQNRLVLMVEDKDGMSDFPFYDERKDIFLFDRPEAFPAYLKYVLLPKAHREMQKLNETSKELLNQVYDTIMDNVASSKPHIAFPVNEVTDAWIGNRIYFHFGNQQYEIEIRPVGMEI